MLMVVSRRKSRLLLSRGVMVACSAGKDCGCATDVNCAFGTLCEPLGGEFDCSSFTMRFSSATSPSSSPTLCCSPSLVRALPGTSVEAGPVWLCAPAGNTQGNPIISNTSKLSIHVYVLETLPTAAPSGDE